MTSPSSSPNTTLGNRNNKLRLPLLAATALAVSGLTSCTPPSAPSLEKTTMESLEKQGDLLTEIAKKAKEAPNKAD